MVAGVIKLLDTKLCRENGGWSGLIAGYEAMSGVKDATVSNRNREQQRP